MRAPAEMRLAQIDITNACVHQCSNCTRLCGNHKKTFYMDWETFREAVDSMEGFQGSVGIIGGEPFLHPDFERFARYLGEKMPVKQEQTAFIKPAKDYMRRLASEELPKYRCYITANGVKDKLEGPSLYTTVTEGFYKHFEMCHDIFRFISVNDHTLPSMHQPILIARKDLGISDEEWIPMRDNCWVQNEWSTSITPKGAFFCEVAASLDMLFNGPGGWPVEKGWWKRKPKDFGEQLMWCEVCGLAIDSYSRDSSEEIDDISPTVYEILKKLKSPRVLKEKVHIVSTNIDELKKTGNVGKLKKNVYLDSYTNRLVSCRKHILPHAIVGAVIYQGKLPTEKFINKINEKLKFLDGIYVLDMKNGLSGVEIDNVKISVIENYFNLEEFTLGKAINAFRNVISPDAFVLLTDEQMDVITKDVASWKEYVCNPGVVIYDSNMLFFSYRASAVRKTGYPGMALVKNIYDFVSLYEEHKRLSFDKDTFSDDLEEFIPGKEYIIYAAGGGGQKVLRHLRDVGARVKFFVDSDFRKWGSEVEGISVVSPQTLKEQQDGCPIVVATVLHSAIVDSLIKMGIDKNSIMISGWAL